MSGINFPITGDNSSFINAMNGVRRSVDTTMKDVEQAGLSIENMFNKIKNAAALSFAGFSGAKLIKDIASVRGEFQQLEVAFSTMLGSEEKAVDLMNQLVKTAAITPFDLKGVADGAKSLMAYGTAAEDVNETLVRLGDIAAGMSIPLHDLVYLYGTTMVQGRMFTQDLRQFQGRGIPIAEELAKVLKVAKEQVPDLVTAGKVTSEVFQQAIVNMTSAGSKFGGLMEKQSKTINGQISNIQDAIDVMFNEIGKDSEGIINGALSTVSMLVENYKTLGKILADLVVAYGTYKTAVMVTSAIQASQAIGLSSLTVAETVHYGWLVLCEKAQALLNKTMLNNPYVLVATAVMTLVAAMITFQHEENGVGKAIDEANSKITKSFAEVEAGINSEQRSIDELFGKLKKAENGTNEYKQVKDKILGQYGQYLQGLNQEIATLNDVEAAYKRVSQAAREAALARGKEAAISKANSDYSQSYSDAMGKIYDILNEKIGESNAKKAIDIIQKDLKDTGEVAEDTQKTLHKYGVDYSLFGDLNKAEQGLITSTNKINALFGEQEKQVQDTAKSVNSLSQDYAEAERNYKIAKNWLTQIEKNKADYTAEEYKKATEDLKAKKEAFEAVGGKVDKKFGGKGGANDKRNRSAKEIEEELKHQDELRKIKQQAIDERTDATIAAEENAAVRERKQQDEQHQLNLRQIEEEANEMRKAIYEHNKTVWETTHKDSPYELTEAGKAGWSAIRLTSDQQEIINAKTEKENAEYTRLLNDRKKQEVDAMRDYLIQYGEMQEKKLAIAQKYADLINEAEGAGEYAKAATYRQQENQELSSVQLEDIKAKIDWEGLFNNLNLYSAEFLTGIRKQLQDIFNDPNITPENAQIISEQISKVNEVIVEKSESTFHWINNYLEEQKRLQEEAALAAKQYADAQEELNNALENRESARLNVEDIVTSMAGVSAENLKGMGFDMSKLTSKNGEDIFKNLGFDMASEQGKKLTEALKKLSAAELKAATAASKAEEAEGKKTTTDAKVEKDWKKKLAGTLGGFADDVNKYLGPLSGIADKLGLGDVAKAMQSGMDGINSAAGAASAFATGDYLGAAMQGLDALQSFGDALGVFDGGLSDKSYAEDMEKLNKSNERLTDSIDRLNKTMENSDFSTIVKAYMNQVGLMDYLEQNKGEQLLRTLTVYDSGGLFTSGDTSAGYEIAKGLTDEEWKKIFTLVGAEAPWRHEKLYYNAGSAHNPFFVEYNKYNSEALGNLTAEQLHKIREEDAALWQKILDLAAQGHEDASKLLNEYADLYDKANEIEENMVEKVLKISFDSMHDNFIDTLMQMKLDADDAALYIAKAISNSLITNMFEEDYAEWLKGWRKNLSEAMKLTGKQRDKAIADLQDEYERTMQEAYDKAEEYRRLTGYTELPESNYQTATYNSAKNITYEQADSIYGVELAQQMLIEQGNYTREIIKQNIESIQMVVCGDGGIISLMSQGNQTRDMMYKAMKDHFANFTSQMNRIVNEIQNQ